jgi:hypothetical protein
MRNVSESSITQAVVSSFDGATDPRFRRIIESLTRHLHAFAREVNLTPEEWKDVLSSAFYREQARLAMGLDGGVVMLGARTSKMGKRVFGEFLEFLHATAADRGVVAYPEEVTA